MALVAALALLTVASLIALGLANTVLLFAIIILLAVEAAKTLFLVKRFSSKTGKSTIGATITAEAVSFACAAALVAALMAASPQHKPIHAAAFCVAFIILRVTSGLFLSKKASNPQENTSDK